MRKRWIDLFFGDATEGDDNGGTYVVNIMENVAPEGVQDGGRDQEATDAHPKAVCKGGESEGDDEVGEDGREKNDKRFSGQEVEEEPHHPREEGRGSWAEVGEPIGCY